jgi:hypothetical protein
MKTPLILGLLATFTLAGCESDFRSDPTRPRVNRALGPNYETNSALGEMNAGAVTGVPILSVEFPNTKEESAKVRTIADPLTGADRPAATRPAPSQRPSIPPDQPAPAIIQQPGARTDPIDGPTR